MPRRTKAEAAAWRSAEQTRKAAEKVQRQLAAAEKYLAQQQAAKAKREKKERQVIRDTENVGDMIKFHHWGGRWIRNHYGLWNPRNKLTKNYFIDGDKYVLDGINYHPQHPDTVSSQVMAEMWNISRTR